MRNRSVCWKFELLVGGANSALGHYIANFKKNTDDLLKFDTKLIKKFENFMIRADKNYEKSYLFFS